MFTTHRFITAVAIGAFLGLASAQPAGQSVPPVAAGEHLVTAAIQEATARAVFEQNIAGYAALHRRLEGDLPLIQTAPDIETARAALFTLATRIQAARPRALQGDIFTPPVAPLFRTLVAMKVPPETAAAILADQAADTPIPLPTLTVNMPWPEEVPCGFMPARLLLALPPLPPELQYRFLGRALVIWDYHANLIVDFLPGVLTT